MKRFLLLLLTLPMIFCCSCKKDVSNSQSEQLEEISSSLTSFESTLKIRYKDINAVATLDKDAPGEGKIIFTSPELLNGLTMEMKSEQLAVDYKGMSFSVDPNSFPANAALKLLVSTIDAAAQKEGMRVRIEDTALIISGESEAGEFELTFDKKNGNALFLSIPEAELEVEFVNFNIS